MKIRNIKIAALESIIFQNPGPEFPFNRSKNLLRVYVPETLYIICLIFLLK